MLFSGKIVHIIVDAAHLLPMHAKGAKKLRNLRSVAYRLITAEKADGDGQ